jgi:hypothetical protein
MTTDTMAYKPRATIEQKLAAMKPPSTVFQMAVLGLHDLANLAAVQTGLLEDSAELAGMARTLPPAPHDPDSALTRIFADANYSGMAAGLRELQTIEKGQL